MQEIDLKKLEIHVKRVCNPNIKRGSKICVTCPFRHIIDQVNNQNGSSD